MCRFLSQWLGHAVVLVVCWVGGPAWATRMVVSYPQPEASNDERSAYPIKMLALALSKSGTAYELQPSLSKMPQGRALAQLAQGMDVNVVWSMTSQEREKDLLPIRIPLDKGLLGWRIFLINKTSAARFGQIKTVEDLGKLECAQGHDWPDTEILRANGLKVQGVPSYDSLFKMLQRGRYDYFPRSVIEIWEEEKSHPGMDLEIEKTLILQYPTALYFFVNKTDKTLAGLIEAGLQTAIKDGSFEKLFEQTYGDIIKRANLKGRTRFQLSNPLLPVQTPLQDKGLWLSY